MKGVIIFFFLSLLFASETISATTIWRSDNEVMSLFEKWLVKHGKIYNALGEKAKRFEIFKENLRFIDEHNKNFPNKTYTLGLNVFADLTDDEYQSWYLGTRIDLEGMLSTFDDSDEYLHQVESESLPDSVDWRRDGFVLPIKNQGRCGSCWAFSAVCSVEWIVALRTGQLTSLSEQELVDCDNTMSKGCDGGYYHLAFDYIAKNGISSGQSYPYTGRVGQCTSKVKVARIDGYKRILANNENALQLGVSSRVISVTIKSSSTEFKLYSSGIFTGQCGNNYDHAVNIVGYGSENGFDYWIMRNSWSTYWGENGYMRIKQIGRAHV